jgi:site-specific DNA recombinase
MKSGVIYARVSTKDQEQEGFSIPSQLKLLHDYAFRNGIEIVSEFIDVETAKTAGRTNFGEMLKFLKRNRNCRIVIVEKTDRLTRNLRDTVEIDDTGAEVHFVKEHKVISSKSCAQDKLVHNFNVVMATHYSNNLSEEVKKGMREKAEQGIYPSRPPLGYRNNKADHTIEIHEENSKIVLRMFELYSTGDNSLSEVRKKIKAEFGRVFQKGYIHKLLRNSFYAGIFEWDDRTFSGTHKLFVPASLYEQVQSVLKGHNRPKYRKHEFAFRGLVSCAHDNCNITAQVKKGKYKYYHCTGYRGKCGTPYMREEELGALLGSTLKDIYIPDDVCARLQTSFEKDRVKAQQEQENERKRLQARLTATRSKIDALYEDKITGKIGEDFWERKNREWASEEKALMLQIRTTEESKAPTSLDLSRILELANKAYSLYERQKPAEQAKLLRLVVSNFATDGVSVSATYRKPFDLIFKRAKSKEWRARRDSNSRPNAPEDLPHE